ncbi:MAG: hypothetical protein MI754_17190, partial [Chromatiales bacterium]|nr:hypothetical protein [Chromatiales bacterium]
MRYLLFFVPTVAFGGLGLYHNGADLLPVSERDSEEINEVSITDRSLVNTTAYIPSQCYTNTVDEEGGVHNPCFSCHTKSQRPNFLNDDDL